VEVGRHPRIELLTLAELLDVQGEPGDLRARVLKHPRYVDPKKCIACGVCADKCPKKVDDEFQMGLAKRKAAYIKFSQAVPLKYAIDPDNCIYLQKGKCRACEKFCPTGAIQFDQKPEEVELRVGAVILTLGSKPYDPSREDVYHYVTQPNVVTSLEFERMLSATGPSMGHLLKASDGEEPAKIAWIQCVGSRSQHPGAATYCSSACCSIAIKQAMLAREHAHGDLDAAIFYIDMRTQGKNAERYYNRARQQGVRFIKSRVGSLEPEPDGNSLRLRYTEPPGDLREENFDLVVLSVGTAVGPQQLQLASDLGLRMDGRGYPEFSAFAPVVTSRPGVFSGGCFRGPKDIPTSVNNASAAAGLAAAILAPARNSLVEEDKPPEMRDVAGDQTRIGVFVCQCGSNIAGVVDCTRVAEGASGLNGVAHVEEYRFACSQDAQEQMAKVIEEKGLNRVVVAACTPRTHEPLFQQTLESAGLNKYLFEMANIRNQCSWVHGDDPEAATEKAESLVAMAVAKAACLTPLLESDMAVNRAALVVGAGVAGLACSLSIARQGFAVHLVERKDVLGGHALCLGQTGSGEDVRENLEAMIQRVNSHELITVHLGAEITQAEGFVGNFRTTIASPQGKEALEHGATIIACGASELRPDGYLHGQSPRVITNMELDKRLSQEDPEVMKAKRVVFLQCVGSRIPERPYCSKVCCTQSVRNALRLKEANPGMQIFVVNRDLRTYGLREDIYREARAEDIHFMRYDNKEPFTVEEGDGALELGFKDWVLSRQVSIQADLLVLAVAIVPEAPNPLAQLYKVAQDEDGFFQEAHPKLRPVDFATDGVFVCGLARAPQPLEESVSQAQAAAARAAAILNQPNLKVGGVVSQIDQSACVGCGVCVACCPYSAIDLDENHKAVVNQATCKGCGSCVAACRSGAPDLPGFSETSVLAQIDTLAL
jgi:heterodisulfide reductase subunit A